MRRIWSQIQREKNSNFEFSWKLKAEKYKWLIEISSVPVEELSDLLQCIMALWIPSCCCASESSLLLAWKLTGGIIWTAADADRLFPRCLHTTRSPAGRLPVLSSPSSLLDCVFTGFLGENIGPGIGEDDGDGDDVVFSPYFLETLMYRGLMSFRYLCTTSFENLFDSNDVVSSVPCLPKLLELFSRVNTESTGTSSTLNLTVKSLLFRGGCSETPLASIFSAFSVFSDFDLLSPNMKTLNLGADLNSEIGDCGFELDSIGRILLLKNSSWAEPPSPLLLLFSSLFWGTASSKSKKESSSSVSTITWRKLVVLTASPEAAVGADPPPFQSLRKLRTSMVGRARAVKKWVLLGVGFWWLDCFIDRPFSSLPLMAVSLQSLKMVFRGSGVWIKFSPTTTPFYTATTPTKKRRRFLNAKLAHAQSLVWSHAQHHGMLFLPSNTQIWIEESWDKNMVVQTNGQFIEDSDFKLRNG